MKKQKLEKKSFVPYYDFINTDTGEVLGTYSGFATLRDVAIDTLVFELTTNKDEPYNYGAPIIVILYSDNDKSTYKAYPRNYSTMEEDDTLEEEEEEEDEKEENKPLDNDKKLYSLYYLHDTIIIK